MFCLWSIELASFVLQFREHSDYSASGESADRRMGVTRLEWFEGNAALKGASCVAG